MTMSGHKSESSLRKYMHKCPLKIKKNMYSMLAEYLPKRQKTEAKGTISKPTDDVDNKQKENQHQIAIPNLNNVQLLPVDPYNDDDLLIKFLEEMEKNDNPTTNDKQNQIEKQGGVLVQNNTIDNLTAQPINQLMPQLYF